MKNYSEEYDKIEVKEGGASHEPIPAGGYVIRIKDVEDNTQFERLRIYFDVLEGEYVCCYDKLPDNLKFLNSFDVPYGKSINGNSLMWKLKQVIEVIEAENKGFEWKWKEAELIGKKLGVVLQDKISESSKGYVVRSLMLAKALPVSVIKTGDFIVPEAYDRTGGKQVGTKVNNDNDSDSDNNNKDVKESSASVGKKEDKEFSEADIPF